MFSVVRTPLSKQVKGLWVLCVLHECVANIATPVILLPVCPASLLLKNPQMQNDSWQCVP